MLSIVYSFDKLALECCLSLLYQVVRMKYAIITEHMKECFQNSIWVYSSEEGMEEWQIA